MSKRISKWTNVREFPSGQKSEESYIRNDSIQRVSIIENDDQTVSVLVHTSEQIYLFTTVESYHEAKNQLEKIVQEMAG